MLSGIPGNWFYSWAPPDAYWIRYFNQPWTQGDWNGPQSSRLQIKFKEGDACDEYIGHYTDTTPGGVYTYDRAEFRLRIFESTLPSEYTLPGTVTEHNTGPVVSIVYHYRTREGGEYDKHQAYAGFLREDKSRGRFMYGFLYAINDNGTAVWMMSDRLNWL